MTTNYSPLHQYTIANSITAKGIGLHTGQQVQIRFYPAAPDHGIVFVRTDLTPHVEIPALIKYSPIEGPLATSIVKDDVTITTIEHLMASIYGCGIDNLRIEVDGPEVPFLDGSAFLLVFILQAAGLVKQSSLRHFFFIRSEITIEEGDGYVSISPSDMIEFEIHMSDFKCEFTKKMTRQMTYQMEKQSFIETVARARTFGFLDQIEKLREMNLIAGGSLDNAIVIERHKGIINESPLRFTDELVRHKLLDAIGDSYLVGCPIIGKLTSHNAGHKLHRMLIHKLVSQEEAWERKEAPSIKI